MVRIEPACCNCPPEVCKGQTCTQKTYECDCCGEICYPDDKDPRQWLYDFEGAELCWACMVDATGITKVE